MTLSEQLRRNRQQFDKGNTDRPSIPLEKGDRVQVQIVLEQEEISKDVFIDRKRTDCF